MYSMTKNKIHVLIKINKTCWNIAKDNNRVYSHVTFCGTFAIQQGLIGCPLHGNDETISSTLHRHNPRGRKFLPVSLQRLKNNERKKRQMMRMWVKVCYFIKVNLTAVMNFTYLSDVARLFK